MSTVTRLICAAVCIAFGSWQAWHSGKGDKICNWRWNCIGMLSMIVGFIALMVPFLA
jgi:hypothetical protein